jgi:hypothetical protein
VKFSLSQILKNPKKVLGDSQLSLAELQQADGEKAKAV